MSDSRVDGSGTPDRLRIGDMVYHVATKQLISAAGAKLFLRSQSALVLLRLAEARGALVTRDELISVVWNGIAVTDDSLTQCIADIRRTLGDEDRSIIRTVPKRGYALHCEPIQTEVPDTEPSMLADVTHHFSAAKTAHLAIGLPHSEAERAAASFPPALRPLKVTARAGPVSILVYDVIGTALQAALHLSKTHQRAVVVDYVSDDETRIERLLQTAADGDVLASPEVATMVHPGVDAAFHDLGELVHPSGQGGLRCFRVTTGADVPKISPQLDLKDVLPTLAILPFTALPDTPERFLGVFLADEISNALSRSTDLNIISRMSTGNLGGATLDLRDLGQLLSADFMLSGTIFRRDNAAIVLLEFSETESQFVLWSDRITLPIDPLLRESDGVQDIVRKIRKAILANEVRRVRSRPLHDLKLFSVLHGAVGLMHRLSPTEFELARSYLDYVISQAPNHPAPLAWLARWHVLRVVQGWSDDVQSEAREALNLTSRALDLDPDHTLALVCEGQVLAHLSHDLEEAQIRYDLALASNPNDPQALALRGMLASFQDRGQEGKRDTERALHLTPLDPHRFFFLALAAGANISAQDFPRAVILAKESLRLNRTHVSTLRTLAVAYEGAGQHLEARQTATELLRHQPDLRVSHWLKSSPSAAYKNGLQVAEMLRAIGIPN